MRRKNIPDKNNSNAWTHTYMGTLSLTKEARIYNGKKTVSSTSGVGRSGQLQKNEIRILPNTTHKDKLEMD